MKTSFRLNALVLFPVLLVLGCEVKNAPVKPEIENVDVKRVNTVKSMANSANQINAYQALNPYEKAYLWQERINNFLDSEKNLTDEQKQHLYKLIEGIDYSLFGADPRPIKQLEDTWSPQAIRLLGKEKTKQLVSSLADGIAKPVRTASNNCDCNGNSMWDCENCGLNTNPCTTVRGCGMFWYYECKKNCDLAPSTGG